MINSLATAFLAVGLLATAPQAPQWEASYGKALEASRSDDQPLLVVLDNPKSDQARVQPALLGKRSLDEKRSELLRPYELCHIDVTTEYGGKVAKAFRAKKFPYMAIIDKTGSVVIFRKAGKVDAKEWERILKHHKDGDRDNHSPVSHVSYKASEPRVYNNPTGGSCPNCQRRSF